MKNEWLKRRTEKSILVLNWDWDYVDPPTWLTFQVIRWCGNNIENIDEIVGDQCSALAYLDKKDGRSFWGVVRAGKIGTTGDTFIEPTPQSHWIKS